MDTKGLNESAGRVLMGLVTDLADLQESVARVQIQITTPKSTASRWSSAPNRWDDTCCCPTSSVLVGFS